MEWTWGGFPCTRFYANFEFAHYKTEWKQWDNGKVFHTWPRWIRQYGRLITETVYSNTQSCSRDFWRMILLHWITLQQTPYMCANYDLSNTSEWGMFLSLFPGWGSNHVLPFFWLPGFDYVIAKCLCVFQNNLHNAVHRKVHWYAFSSDEFLKTHWKQAQQLCGNVTTDCKP